MCVKYLLPNGVGLHHGGMIAPLRELMEELYAKSLLPVLFCTETCAIGLHLPTRSVVFASMGKGLQKFDGVADREVSSGEYKQMTGRAGRRGFDPLGNVVFCCGDEDIKLSKKSKDARNENCFKQFSRIVLRNVEPVSSMFTLGFSTLLNLLRFGHVGYVVWLELQSFRQFQSRFPQLPAKTKNPEFRPPAASNMSK